MIVTYIMIGICSLFFIYIRFISNKSYEETVWDLGAMVPSRVIRNQEYYRLLVCHFLHIDFMHLFFNLYCIYILGGMFEELFGSVIYLYIIVFSMIISSLCIYLEASLDSSKENTMTIGASGIFYGFLGVIVSLGLFVGGGYFLLLRSYIYVIVINVAFTFFNKSVSKMGHLGGFIGGFLAAMILHFLGML